MRLPRSSSSPSERTSSFPCRPAPQTSVCALSSAPDFSVTRVGETEATASPVISSTVRFSRAFRVYARMSGLNIVNTSGPASTRTMRALVLREIRVVARERRAVQLGERAGGLDARRPATDDDDVQRAVVHERAILVRRFPQAEHVLLEAHGVTQCVHRERVVGGALCAEEVDLSAEPEDEIVVCQRLEVVETDFAGVQVDLGHRRLVDDSVVLAIDEVTQ